MRERERKKKPVFQCLMFSLCSSVPLCMELKSFCLKCVGPGGLSLSVWMVFPCIYLTGQVLRIIYIAAGNSYLKERVFFLYPWT